MHRPSPARAGDRGRQAMKYKPLEYILFAAKQAIEAEQHDFPRNVCCRNLKLAIEHYWRKKTLMLPTKKQISRSLKASSVPLQECDIEHAVPMMVIVNMLMDQDTLTLDFVKTILESFYRVCLVTKDEHRRLNKIGLVSRMPSDWNRADVWARYRRAGIEPCSSDFTKMADYSNVKLGTPEERRRILLEQPRMTTKEAAAQVLALKEMRGRMPIPVIEHKVEKRGGLGT